MTHRRTTWTIRRLRHAWIGVNFAGVCNGQTDVLTQEVMDLAVLGAQISVLTYDTAGASEFAARNPIPIYHDRSVSHRGGVYVNGRYTSWQDYAWIGDIIHH